MRARGKGLRTSFGNVAPVDVTHAMLEPRLQGGRGSG